MLKFLTKIFQKNTKICDQCGCGIDPKKDAAICLHGEQLGVEFEVYVCENCAEQAWLDTLNDELFEGINAEEDRDNHSQ